MKRRNRNGRYDRDECDVDDIVKSAEKLSAKISRDIAAIEAEKRRQNARLGYFALGLFLGVSLFGCEGE